MVSFFNKNKVKMKNLKMLRTSSKRSLMDSSIFVCEGDYKKAGELYDLYATRMELPDNDPVPLSKFEQVKDTAGSIFGWVKENQNDILNGLEFIKGLRNKGGNIPPTSSGAPLPPL